MTDQQAALVEIERLLERAHLEGWTYRRTSSAIREARLAPAPQVEPLDPQTRNLVEAIRSSEWMRSHRRSLGKSEQPTVAQIIALLDRLAARRAISAPAEIRAEAQAAVDRYLDDSCPFRCAGKPGHDLPHYLWLDSEAGDGRYPIELAGSDSRAVELLRELARDVGFYSDPDLANKIRYFLQDQQPSPASSEGRESE